MRAAGRPDTCCPPGGRCVGPAASAGRQTSPSLPRGMPSIPDTLFLRSSNRSSRIPFCRDRKENGASLNSRSWTVDIITVLHPSPFFIHSPKESKLWWLCCGEQTRPPNTGWLHLKSLPPGWSGSSPVSVMAPCNSAGCPCLHSADPRPDKVTMAPLRPRLYTCDAI